MNEGLNGLSDGRLYYIHKDISGRFDDFINSQR